MSDGPKRPRAEILPIAEELLGMLKGACVRIEMAGSLRRERPEVGDIELVAIPAIEDMVDTGPADLFGQSEKKAYKVNRLWAALDGFFEPQSGRLARGTYIRKGDKYRSFSWPTRSDARSNAPAIQVDLFTATKDTWGNQFLIRTGSADFSHYVMQRLNHHNYTSWEGAIYRSQLGIVDNKWRHVPIGDYIPTPTEQHVFDLAGIQFRQPHQRT